MKAKIFVSVGTHSRGFERLLKKIDEIARKNGSEFEFFAQAGNTDYRPENFKSKKFLSPEEMDAKIGWADLVLCHGGAGIIGPGILEGKKIIAVPRLKEFREHTDNHQLELARAVEREYGIKCVTDFNSLEGELRKELLRKNAAEKKENAMEKMVAEFIEKEVKRNKEKEAGAQSK